MIVAPITEQSLVSKKRVMELTSLSDTTIWRMEKKGDFPKRRQISRNRVAWLFSDIKQWLEKQTQ